MVENENQFSLAHITPLVSAIWLWSDQAKHAAWFISDRFYVLGCNVYAGFD